MKDHLKKIANENRELQKKLHETENEGSAAASMSSVNQTHLGKDVQFLFNTSIYSIINKSHRIVNKTLVGRDVLF